MRARGANSGELLDGLRVLDLADGSGAMCGRILSDLGADVIKVEPPGGDVARLEPPFAADIPDAERGLTWFAANVNKRGITLDRTGETGKRLFTTLATSADIVIETPQPGCGLDYDDLACVNERLILVTLTPYGPDSDLPGSDLEITASSGALWLAGEAGRTPVRTSLPQSPGWMGMYAAAGALMAVLAREHSGKGQHVDVSGQASLVTAISQAPIFWDLLQIEQYRSGPFLVGRSVTGAHFRNIWPCKDGYVTFALYGGQAGRESARALVSWMNEALPGGAPELLQHLDWDQFDVASAPRSVVEDIEAAIAPFFLGLTKAEFFNGVTTRNVLGYPVSTVEDLAADQQLASRGFWEPVDSSWNGEVCMPGSFALFDGERPPMRRGAPRIGEHNVDVYVSELGLSRSELVALRSSRVI